MKKSQKLTGKMLGVEKSQKFAMKCTKKITEKSHKTGLPSLPAPV